MREGHAGHGGKDKEDTREKKGSALSKVQTIRSVADVTFEAIEYDGSNSNAHLSLARGYS